MLFFFLQATKGCCNEKMEVCYDFPPRQLLSMCSYDHIPQYQGETKGTYCQLLSMCSYDHIPQYQGETKGMYSQ